MYTINSTLIDKLIELSIFLIKEHIGYFIYYSNDTNKYYLHKYCLKLSKCLVSVEGKMLTICGIRVIAKNYVYQRIIRNYLIIYLSMTINNKMYNCKMIRCFINAIASLDGHASYNNIQKLYFVKNIQYNPHSIFLVTNKQNKINKEIGNIIHNTYEFNNIILNSTVNNKIVDHYIYKINTSIDIIGKMNKSNTSNRKAIFNLYIKANINNSEMNNFIEKIII